MSRLELILPGDVPQDLYRKFNLASQQLNKQYSSVVFVDDLGARKNATTDDSDAVREAFDQIPEGGTVMFGPCTGSTGYALKKTIHVNKRVNIVGLSSRIILSEDRPCFDISHVNRVRVNGLDFHGSGKSSGKTDQIAIYTYQSHQSEFDNLYFESIGGICLFIGNDVISNQSIGSNVLGCRLRNNNIGIMTSGRGEYNNIVGLHAVLNNVGIYDDSGNNNVSGFVMVYNAVGFRCRAGANNGHGQIIGGNINHCGTRSLDIQDTSTGYLISGVSFWDAPFLITDSDLVIMTRCIFDASGGQFNGGSGNGIENSSFLTTSDPRSVITGTGGAVYFVRNLVDQNGRRYNFGSDLGGFSKENVRVNTTNATPTTLRSIPIATNTIVSISGKVTARRTGGSSGSTNDSAAYEFNASYVQAGGVAVEKEKTITALFEDQSGWDVQLNLSGTNALLQVQGAVDNNITWQLSNLNIERT